MPIYFTFVFSFIILVFRHTSRILITLYAINLGAEPLTIGTLVAMFAVLPMLLSWHVGRLCDRFGSRWPLTFATIVGALGILIPFFQPGVPALFATSFLLGLSSAFSAAPMQNLVGLLSGAENSTKNFNNYSLVVTSATFIAPLFAGFSIDHIGARGTCLILTFVVLTTTAILAIWGKILPPGTRPKKTTENIKELLSESGLWRILITSSLVVTGVELFQVYVPIYGHNIGFSGSEIGVILSIYSAAAFIVRFFLPFLLKRFGITRILSMAFIVASGCFALVPFVNNIAGLSILSFFFGLSMGCGQPITMMMTFSNSTPGRSGEAMGIRVTSNQVARVLCQILFGTIASALGVLPIFWINSFLLIFGWVASRSQHHSQVQANVSVN